MRFFKSPLWPAFLSGFVVPGLGQIINGEIQKGMLLITASVGSFVWFSKVVTERLSALLPGTPDQWAKDQQALRQALLKMVNENPDMFLTFQVLMLLTWGFAVVDAYLSARKKPFLLPPARKR